MISTESIVAIIIAYLLGAIPTAVWIGQLFYGIDVREYGSGNAGATNTFRVLGKKAGIPVLLFDIMKGFFAIKLSFLFSGVYITTEQMVNFQLILGIAALLGHIFPIYAGFRGGKGIATLLGIIFAIHLQAAMLAMGVFFMVFLLTRFVSLGSMISALSFPIIVIVIYKSSISSLVIFSLFIPILVLITHQKNIERLLRGEENKTRIIKRNKDNNLS